MKTLQAGGRFPNKRHTSGVALARALLGATYPQRAEILVREVNDAARIAYHMAVMEADPGAELQGETWTLSNGSTITLRAVRRAEEAHHVQ